MKNSRTVGKKTKFLAVAAICTAMLATSSAADGQGSELVKNGSFDKNEAGWQLEHDNFGGFKKEADGNGYVALNHDGVQDPTMSQTLEGLVPGEEYILTARYRPGSHVAKHGTANAPFFKISVGAVEREYKLLSKDPGQDWKSLFLKFTAKATTAVLTIEGEIHEKDNDVSIDDVSVKSTKVETFQIRAYTIKGAPGNNETYFIAPGKSGARAMAKDISEGQVQPADFVKMNSGKSGIAFKLHASGSEGGLFLAVNDKKEVTFAASNDNNIPESAIFNVVPPLYAEAGKGWNSFESSKFPSHYLRHFQFKLDVSSAAEARNTRVNYHRDATWTMSGAAGPDLADKTVYIKFPLTGAYLSYKNDEVNQVDRNEPVYLVQDGTAGYTKVKAKVIKQDAYIGFQVLNIKAPSGKPVWLEIQDNHNLAATTFREAKIGVPARGFFLTQMSPYGRFLEAMWVNTEGASKAKIHHPDHHYYLTASGSDAVQRAKSTDFKVDQPKDTKAGWELVSADD